MRSFRFVAPRNFWREKLIKGTDVDAKARPLIFLTRPSARSKVVMLKREKGNVALARVAGVESQADS